MQKVSFERFVIEQLLGSRPLSSQTFDDIASRLRVQECADLRRDGKWSDAVKIREEVVDLLKNDGRIVNFMRQISDKANRGPDDLMFALNLMCHSIETWLKQIPILKGDRPWPLGDKLALRNVHDKEYLSGLLTIASDHYVVAWEKQIHHRLPAEDGQTAYGSVYAILWDGWRA